MSKGIPLPVQATAAFSPDRRHRYTLVRIWDPAKPMICFIGLNPSTADETANDPTIRKCMKFARRWGYGGILMLNLFAWRTHMPMLMFAAADKGADIIGPGNRIVNMVRVLRRNNVTRIVCAWGRHGGRRGVTLLSMLKAIGFEVHCFKQNKDGSPIHPLYQRDDSETVAML